MKPIRKDERAFEESCARKLVALLCRRHEMPLEILAVSVASDWKVVFTFTPTSEYGRPDAFPKSERYGRRPGLEIHWDAGAGDVDAWQFDGDVVSLVTHGFWQILKEKLTRRCERPSKLLALVEKQNTPDGPPDFAGA